MSEYCAVAAWVMPYGKSSHYLIVASPQANGVIQYHISNASGTPVSSEYFSSTFYRERPVVVQAGWRNDLRDAVKMGGDILSWRVAQHEVVQ